MTTTIEWVARPGTIPESWNVTTGCTPISEGCRHCYAERMSHRLQGRAGYPEAPHQFDVTLHPDRLEQPLRWKKPRTVFVVSMGDLFHKFVPPDYIIHVYEIMAACPQHTFMVLTKRPDRIVPVLYGQEGGFYLGGGDYLPNVWHLTSAENQETADIRVPELLKLRGASCGWPVLGVSVEPMLGPVDISHWLKYEWIDCMDGAKVKRASSMELDWIICGGESGPGARPMHPEWAQGLRDQCQESGTAYFMKQWGAWFPRSQWEDNPDLVLPDDDAVNDSSVHTWDDGELSHRVGKQRAGRLLDGLKWNQWPI
ncbi:MAG TPA: phage Gp37/Gp68 family protein [Anaerolineae bacterium]|nr:phage Gp37/Gp68 family protein [Anaerolineae bacterium]